jgi:hypothetical protein
MARKSIIQPRSSRTAAPTVLSYDYQSQGGQPPNGKCYQSSSALAQVAFSYNDAVFNDNTTFLNGIAVGDQITANGVTWTITAAQPKGSNIVYTVEPAVAAPPLGTTSFSFGQTDPNKGTAVTVTIPAGETESNSVDLSTGGLMAILSPLEWTPANVSFLVSADNVSFRNMYDGHGNEVIHPMGANRSTIIDPSLTAGAIYVKIRSGPAQNPIVQADDRIFTLVIS